MNRTLIAGIVVCFAAAGCHSVSEKTPAHEVRIAAAADLKFALDEMIAEFKRRRPDIDVKATYGASGNFFAQISNRAPFDLFLSADVEYPGKLVEQNLAIKETAFTYAIGHLVIWVPNASKLDLQKDGMEVLLDPAINKIAVANPKHAPYGRAAVAALKKLSLYERIEGKLVYGDNVAQTAQFVDTGAADVGLIPLSLAKAPAMRDKGRFADVPPDSYPRLDQGGVVLTWVQDRAAADAFRGFMTSEEGKALLRRYAFIVPGD
jgi:molybdate transport system substrate-binding protein